MEALMKKRFAVDTPMDSAELSRQIGVLAQRHPELGIMELGRSILGKPIPILSIGHGKRSVLYVGTHHGMEWITSVILLRFVAEYCDLLDRNEKVYKQSLRLLTDQYTFFVIPMLNPDGVDYQIHGLQEENPLYDRALSMNGGSYDFSHWQANARGVDLNHNYNAGFQAYKQIEAEEKIPCGAPTRYSGQEPESEPEVRVLCNFIRFQKDLRLVLTLHTQGEEIFCRLSEEAISRNFLALSRISALTGYKISEAEGPAAYGGLTDWCIQKQGLTALTLECGKGVNPLPLTDHEAIYRRLRETLFVAPTLF